MNPFIYKLNKLHWKQNGSRTVESISMDWNQASLAVFGFAIAHRYRVPGCTQNVCCCIDVYLFSFSSRHLITAHWFSRYSILDGIVQFRPADEHEINERKKNIESKTKEEKTIPNRSPNWMHTYAARMKGRSDVPDRKRSTLWWPSTKQIPADSD